jgi:broad specificity phosphatase PhoE
MITYIRHGESEYNNRGIMQGIDDPDLSSNGVNQAEALAERLGERLGETRNVRIFTSPLKRAFQTAQTAASRSDIDIAVIDDLKEIDIGVFSNLTWAQVKAKYPHLFKDPDVSFWKLFRDDAIPGQEPYASMVQRIERALSVIRIRSGDTLPIIFGHGGFLRIFIAEQLGFRLVREGIRIDNTSINRFDYKDGLATFHRINDIDHLADSDLKQPII